MKDAFELAENEGDRRVSQVQPETWMIQKAIFWGLWLIAKAIVYHADTTRK